MNNFKTLCEQLTAKIQKSYEEGTTLEDAEKLAAEFLYAQLQVSAELTNADRDSRMKRTGTKAVKAAVYMQEATKTDKKPSDVMLQALVDKDVVVRKAQDDLDEAEVSKAELERYLDVFNNAHIHYRNLSKGQFN